MSLGTIVLICLAALFFGGLLVLNRVSGKELPMETGAFKPSVPNPSETATAPGKEGAARPAGRSPNVTPMPRPSKSQVQGSSRRQAKHGT